MEVSRGCGGGGSHDTGGTRSSDVADNQEQPPPLAMLRLCLLLPAFEIRREKKEMDENGWKESKGEWNKRKSK